MRPSLCVTFLRHVVCVTQIKGVEPLGNVLEYYGGNDSKMRDNEDFLREDDDQNS